MLDPKNYRTPWDRQLLKLSKSIGELPDEDAQDFSFESDPLSGEDHEAHLIAHEGLRGSLTMKAARGNWDAASQLTLLEKHIAYHQQFVQDEGYNSDGKRRMRETYSDPKTDAEVTKARTQGAKDKVPRKRRGSGITTNKTPPDGIPSAPDQSKNEHLDYKMHPVKNGDRKAFKNLAASNKWATDLREKGWNVEQKYSPGQFGSTGNTDFPFKAFINGRKQK